MSNERRVVPKFLEDNALHFKNNELLLMALTHPSYAQEKKSIHNNQRLEFLGDAVLNLIVAEYLYGRYEGKAEGELTKIRAKVVCEKSLLHFARKLQLGDYLFLGKGEEMSGGRTRRSILADTVEAVIGAIYLDCGFVEVKNFVLKHMEGFIIKTAKGDYQDYKSRLQEIVQGVSKENVNYAIIKESGPAHFKTFVAGVYHKGILLATGEGRSKKEAEQQAAENVIKNGHFMDRLTKDKD